MIDADVRLPVDGDHAVVHGNPGAEELFRRVVQRGGGPAVRDHQDAVDAVRLHLCKGIGQGFRHACVGGAPIENRVPLSPEHSFTGEVHQPDAVARPLAAFQDGLDFRSVRGGGPVRGAGLVDQHPQVHVASAPGDYGLGQRQNQQGQSGQGQPQWGKRVGREMPPRFLFQVL